MGKIKKKYPCALILTHDLIGGKWKLRILWHIIHGENRFSLLMRAIPDISQKVLVSQLRGLVSLIECICRYTKDYARGKSIYVPA